ncbi:Hypothetical protein POVN_LOCUS532 [uncultured virus]|nr:Hypothetical protein POVN_LOCUS532 [uncultured virus]
MDRLPLPFTDEVKFEPQYVSTPVAQELGLDKDKVATIVMKTKRKRNVSTFIVRCLTSEIPEDKHFRRSSVVPFCVKDGMRYYFMCIDAKYGEVTDAGGTVVPGETFMGGGTRELWEESMRIFDFKSEEAQKHIRNNSVAIYNETSIFIFQPVEVECMKTLCFDFRQRYWKATRENASRHLVENSHMIWISEPDLRSLALFGSKAEVKLPLDLISLLRPNVTLPTSPKSSCTYPHIYRPIRTLLAVAFANYNELF